MGTSPRIRSVPSPRIAATSKLSHGPLQAKPGPGRELDGSAKLPEAPGDAIHARLERLEAQVRILESQNANRA